ncbi:MAG: PRC-barrel domain-containing protein [Dongiaceae bacterium]
MATRLMTASTLVLALTAGAALAQTADSDAVENETVTPPSDGQVIVEQEPSQTLTKDLIGADVMHAEHGNIGTLEALLFDGNDRIVGGVVSIGGFLGLGAKEVALSWDAFDVRTDENAVYVDLTKEQLEAAPSFMDRADVRAEEAAQQAQREMDEGIAPLPAPTLDAEPSIETDPLQNEQIEPDTTTTDDEQTY